MTVRAKWRLIYRLENGNAYDVSMIDAQLIASCITSHGTQIWTIAGLSAESRNPSAFAQLRNILDPCAGCFRVNFAWTAFPEGVERRWMGGTFT